MGYIVDPRPQVEAELERLRGEHEPKIQEAKQAVAAAGRGGGKADRAAAKQVLKERQSAYRRARREAKAILRAPMSW